MTFVPIKGYNVGFPYATPYDLQKVYMEKVLTCLDDGRHGVLESPTGTGKTLCLFAPVAAWAKKRKQDREQSVYFEQDPKDLPNPEQLEARIWRKVWYTSRTHSQIGQTVTEVRKCNIDNLNIRVMGSREQLCINPEVMEEKEAYAKVVKCKGLVKNKTCPYYNKYLRNKDSVSFFKHGEVLDIEDLVSAGITHKMCPYYMSKSAAETADIVLLPYNYIIDRDSREGNSLQLNNDVVIFDEGHNIPAKCEESYEFTLTTLDIVSGIKSVHAFLNFMNTAPLGPDKTEIGIEAHLEHAEFIKNTLESLEREMRKLGVTNELRPVAYLYQFFERAGIVASTAEKILIMLNAFQEDANALNLPGNVLTVFHLLEKMLIVTYGPTIRLFDQKTIEKSFKCGITVENRYRPNECKKISLFCFNPSFGIQALLQLGVQSIIITSGTLSPLKTFIYELGLPYPVTLENGHIAEKCQVPFVILEQGVFNEKMDSTYKNRQNPKYITSLGHTLTNLISSIPDGVLLLFASYAMMDNLKEEWESQGIWTRLTNLKRVFIEPRGKEEFINCMENYKRAIDSGNGAVLLGVLRGKISEGMDFKDQYCRGVFVVGVPFPPVTDPKIKGKQIYCEDLTYFNPEKKIFEKLYTQSFTMIEAMKVTNQAVGRVIRHRNDYGAIILVDCRFAWSSLFFNISRWLRGDKASPKTFPETKRLLGEFFRNIHSGKLGVPEIRCQKIDEKCNPVAGHIPFEEYDHKTAVREYNHNSYAKEYVYDSPVKSYDYNTPAKLNNFNVKVEGNSTVSNLDCKTAYMGKSAITYVDSDNETETESKVNSSQTETDLKPIVVKQEIVYSSPSKNQVYIVPVKNEYSNYSPLKKDHDYAVASMTAYSSNSTIEKEHDYGVPVKLIANDRLVEAYKYKEIVEQNVPKASSSKATLAYRNAIAGKSNIVYEDDSTDSDETICDDENSSSVILVSSDEEDTGVVSAMDKLNSNETDLPLKDIGNNKRKHLGEHTDSQSLIKSPCLERRSNVNNGYQRF